MSISEKIFEIVSYINESSPDNEHAKRNLLEEIETKWENLPEDKYLCQERALIAYFMIDEHLGLKQFEKAYKWTDVLLFDRKGDLSDVGFTLGRVDFEAGKFGDALENFKMAFEDSKGRVFQEKDPKYLDFLQNPEKYMTK